MDPSSIFDSTEDWTLIDSSGSEAGGEVPIDDVSEQTQPGVIEVSQRVLSNLPLGTDSSENKQQTGDFVPNYTYSPLPAQKWFRLLRLSCKNDHESIVRCQLVPFALDSHVRPAYRAVSHTWGKGPPGSAVLIGTCQLKVHRDLAEMLKGIRYDAHDCWLWVDAICIDQTSHLEKNHQVKLMGEIYSRANLVLAWLGSDDSDIKHAFEIMSLAIQGGVYVYFESQDPEDLMLGKNGSMDAAWEYDWLCIAKLLKLRYWTRRWIVQEVILARSVVFRVGQSQYAMQLVEDFFNQLRQRPYVDGERNRFVETLFAASTFDHMHTALLARHRAGSRNGSKGPSTLYELLWLYSDFECQEPSDQVYALYNLIGCHREHLQVNYEQTAANRCIEVLSFMQEHEPHARRDLIRTAIMLCRQLGLDNKQDLQQVLQQQKESLCRVQVSIFDREEIQNQAESTVTIAMRNEAPALQRIQSVLFNCQQGMSRYWENIAHTSQSDFDCHLPSSETTTINETMDIISPQDMSCFSVTSPSRFGLATNEVRPGDRIWQFKHTNLAFVVRQKQQQQQQPEIQGEISQDERKDDSTNPAAVEDDSWGWSSRKKAKLKSRKKDLKVPFQGQPCEIIGRALIYKIEQPQPSAISRITHPANKGLLPTQLAVHDGGAHLEAVSDGKGCSVINLSLTYPQFFELAAWAQRME